MKVVVAGSAQVTIFWTFASGTTQGATVLGAVKGGTPISQAMANALDTAIKGQFSAGGGYGTHVHTTASLAAVGVRDTSAADQAMFIGSGGAIPGTAAGDALPPSTSLVVSLKTAQAGARYRGRVYLGGFSEADNQSNGQATAALGTACANFVQAISTAMAAQQLTLAVMSRPSEQKTYTLDYTDQNGTAHHVVKVQAARPGAITPISSINLRNTVWDTQRRRGAPGKLSTLFLVPLMQFPVLSETDADTVRQRRA